jgi:hypothetical protein
VKQLTDIEIFDSSSTARSAIRVAQAFRTANHLFPALDHARAMSKR